MTARADGARSTDVERARFLRALAASLALHAALFPLKFGPISGLHGATSPGGVIQAVLRRAPVMEQLSEAGAAAENAFRPASVIVAPGSSTAPHAAPQPAGSESPSVAVTARPQTAPAMRSEGNDAVAGIAPGAEAVDAIPLLPPISMVGREPPRRPMLLAPLNFSYPPNTRMQSGRVRVRLLLDERGAIEEVRAVAAIPPGLFEQAAVEVVRKGRYAPAAAGSVPVRSYLFLEVSYGPGPLGQQVWYGGSTIAPPDYKR